MDLQGHAMNRTTISILSLALLFGAPVLAQDCNLDGLPDSQQVNVQGLTAQYFANRTWSGPPAAVRVDLGGAGSFELSNWSLPAGVPSDEFSVRWMGGLQFNQTAPFQFRISADDAYRLYLDGVLLGSSNGVVGNQIVPQTPITVTAGIHHFRIEFREDYGEAKIKVERKISSATTWSVIANTNFKAGVDANANNILDLCDSGDCNGNFLPDAIDIAQDPSLDCNSNAILDTCETTANDCDQNGVPDTCEASAMGLVGYYFGTNNFTGPVIAKRLDGGGPLGIDFNVTDGNNNAWMPSNVPTDNFSVRWGGALVVETSGYYDFQMQSDDLGNLYIDGVLLFSSNTGTEERGPFYLEAGRRLMSLTLREFGGDQRMRLRWRQSGTADWFPLPGTMYRPSFDGNGDGVADVCQSGDCNANGTPDGFELANGLATDCDADNLLDSCEVASGATDCNANGIPDSCESTSTGLFGRYFARLGSSSPSDPYRPGQRLAVRRDARVAFADGAWLPQGIPTDNIIVIWTGSITTGPESGLWTFRTDSDDGARLTIDGATVIDGWLGNAGVRTGSITLQGNTTYDFKLELHEGNGGQQCILDWSPPSSGGSAFSIVPTTAFRMATPDCNSNNIPDDCDIASGTLPDPGFGIPDPCASSACPADLDLDGLIGGGDLGILIANWGTSGGDIDGDGTSNGQDLGVMLSAWGPCP